jgi:hypothetical protein
MGPQRASAPPVYRETSTISTTWRPCSTIPPGASGIPSPGQNCLKCALWRVEGRLKSWEDGGKLKNVPKESWERMP